MDDDKLTPEQRQVVDAIAGRFAQALLELEGRILANIDARLDDFGRVAQENRRRMHAAGRALIAAENGSAAPGHWDPGE